VLERQILGCEGSGVLEKLLSLLFRRGFEGQWRKILGSLDYVGVGMTEWVGGVKIVWVVLCKSGDECLFL